MVAFSGKVTADRRDQSQLYKDIAHEHPTPLVSVEGTKASLQEKKKRSRTFEPVQKARPAGNLGKIRNYNIKD